MKLILDCKDDRLEPEVLALAVNLALNPGCAEQFCDYKHGKGLKLLMKRAYKYKDIRTLMYTVSAKLDQFDARLASNRSLHLQKTFQKYNYEIEKTENDFFQSPRLRKR